MKKTLVALVVCLISLGVSLARAGVEPSPFKDALQAQIDLIITNITPLTLSAPGTTTGDPDVQAKAIELVTQLQAVDVQTIGRKVVTTQAALIMERISALLFAPQPEPPKAVKLAGLNAMSRLASVAFAPQPEPPAHTARYLDIFDRISAVGFAPQPEPPRLVRDAIMFALDGISAIAFDAQPAPPGRVPAIMAVFDAVSAIAFDPQPEPPGISTKATMFNILDLFQDIAVPTVIPTGE